MKIETNLTFRQMRNVITAVAISSIAGVSPYSYEADPAILERNPASQLEDDELLAFFYAAINGKLRYDWETNILSVWY